jgi:hypothetical protein
MKTLLLALMVAAAGEAAFAAPAAAQSKPAAAAPADLDRLLGPIALYPDSLIAQMLLCAATPPKIVELKTWLGANATLKGTALQDAATVAGFEPSFVALSLFPQVVSYMADRLDWTKQLGAAFAANRSAVFDSIQRLRKQAQDSGALKTTPQQEVETTTTSTGQQVIVIEPANPQIIYVPQYDPQVVYVEDDDSDEIVAGVIGFTAGIALGAAIDNDYYYGPWGFHGGVHMYNDAWDDWADHRDEARDDWTDHRENLADERGDRAREGQDQRTERTENRQDGRTDRAGERTGTTGTQTERTGERAQGAQQGSRGYADTSATRAAPDRSGTKSDAFSGYSNGKSERAASSRGQQSRSSSGASRSSGGGGSRGGGGRRR